MKWGAWLILAGVIVALLLYGIDAIDERGYNRCTAENEHAIQAKEKELGALRTQQQADRAEFNARLTAHRTAADRRIRELLARDQSLRVWWDTTVPAAAVDFAFGGMPASGDNPVPPGE